MFQKKRTYLLNIGEKTPFRKIEILEKLLLCEMSSSTANKMRSHQTLRNINHFIGGHNLFQTKRIYLLNILGLHCHAMKNKNANHSIQKD